MYLWTDGAVEKWITAARPALLGRGLSAVPHADRVVHSAACEFCYSSDGMAADLLLFRCSGCPAQINCTRVAGCLWLRQRWRLPPLPSRLPSGPLSCASEPLRAEAECWSGLLAPQYSWPAAERPCVSAGVHAVGDGCRLLPHLVAREPVASDCCPLNAFRVCAAGFGKGPRGP